MLSNEPKMIISYVAPKCPNGGLKNAKRPISASKIAFRLKKVCYKVSLCENCSQQVSFIDLTIRAKMTGVGRPLLREILCQSDRVGSKSPIFDLFSLIVPQPYDLAKSSINTNRKPTTHFSMSSRSTSYVVSKPPPRVAQKRKVSKS